MRYATNAPNNIAWLSAPGIMLEKTSSNTPKPQGTWLYTPRICAIMYAPINV